MKPPYKKLGKVYLVGAGPGDSGLLTLKGLGCLKKADVIIYDRLAKSVIKFANKTAELIYVGKSDRVDSISQVEINRLLLKWAREKDFIVRLKGGDPFIFGRGAEEALFLYKNKIPFEVVPGVSSVFSVPAYSGIPLTHRDYSSTVKIITGHEAKGKKFSNIDWRLLAKDRGTLVFLMAAKRIDFILKKLLRFGMKETRPVAIIMNGTMPNQRTIVRRLKDILEMKEKVTPPAVLVIGEVVDLRRSLRWFKEKPLFKKRILITRPAYQAEEFENLLKDLGAEIIRFPTIRLSPIKDSRRIREAIEGLGGFDCLIFTSANGVRIFFKNIKKKIHLSKIKDKKICAIGPKTARELKRKGLNVSLMPKIFTQEGILEIFKKIRRGIKKILLINSKLSRPVLEKGLKKLGLEVDAVPIYETKIPGGMKKIKQRIDFITFTSPSTVRNFLRMQTKDVLKRLLKEAKVASIGPVTSKALRDLGIEVSIEAKEHTIEGLAKSICDS